MPHDDAGTADLDVTRPFTRAQAIAAGIDVRLLRGAGFRSVCHGVYVSSTRRHDPLLGVEAALVVHPPEAFASHVSAARVYNIPVPTYAEEHVSVLHEDDRRRRRGVACHIASPATRVVTFKGVRVSAPANTFIELASMLTLVDLVIAGDYIVRRQWYTPTQLVEICRASKDRHAGAALAAATYVREGVDSPMETRLRMLIVLAGLPEPEVNFTVRDESGRVLRRFDLSYPRLKLLVEYDGRQHAEDAEQYDSDMYRREDLDRWGWRLVIVTRKGIYEKPEETLTRVRSALRERGCRDLPRRLSDGWRPHFPGQRPVRRRAG
jgi:hypothetical protein